MRKCIVLRVLLDALSRVFAKKGETLTPEAFEALPAELREGLEHPDKEEWDRLAAEVVREDGTVHVSIGRLAYARGLPQRLRLTLKQSEAISGTADYVGMLIEPDARITGRAYSWEESVALIRPEEGVSQHNKESKYNFAGIMLEFGIFIADADGTIEPDEVDHVAGFLESQFMLDQTESRRLEALKGLLLENPPSISGAGKRVSGILDEAQRRAVGRFLVGVAAANGSIDKKEVTALRTAYKALAVPAEELEQLLEEFRRIDQEPVEVFAPVGPTESGEAIPTRPAPKTKDIINLNEDLLRRIMRETEQVARLIGEAMLESDLDEATETGVPGVSQVSEGETNVLPVIINQPNQQRFDGLEARYHAVLSELVLSQVWKKSDFDTLIRKHSLMPSGTIDVINEWAEVALGDMILQEHGSDIKVLTELLPTV